MRQLNEQHDAFCTPDLHAVETTLFSKAGQNWPTNLANIVDIKTVRSDFYQHANRVTLSFPFLH
eukprot:scaffold4491_cov130-Skeletonema_marinoi.AAC.9